MERILALHSSDFDPVASAEIDRSGFTHRQAARAVVLDEAGAVGLMHVSREAYFKLPGGGMDEGEDMLAALKREVLEELGCTIEVTGELGEVLEYRDYWQMVQTSHAYLARVVGQKGQPALTELEASQGFAVTWQKDIDTAIHLIETQQPHGDAEPLNYLFMQKRDLAVLEAARAALRASG